MDTIKQVVVEFLGEDVVACLDKDKTYCFDLYISNSLGCCFEYFLLAHPLEQYLEGTLGEQCIVHHIYGKVDGCSETHVHLSHYHKKIKSIIYLVHLDYGRYRGCYENYIHLSSHCQHLIRDCERKKCMVTQDLNPPLPTSSLLSPLSITLTLL